MKKAIILEKSEKISEKHINNKKMSTIKKIIDSKANGKLEEINNWTDGDVVISLYGYSDGEAGDENKHELPPPVDSKLFFGDLVLVKEKSNQLTDFSKEEFKIFYEKYCGGFEDIESSEDENFDSEEIDKEDSDSDYIPSSDHDSDEDDEDFENNISSNDEKEISNNSDSEISDIISDNSKNSDDDDQDSLDFSD